MSISDDDLLTINPIGLYVVGSTQIIDRLDSLQRDYTIDTVGKSICEYFKSKGYNILQLNSQLPLTDVFDKYFGSFYIDEDTVAAIAKENGCSTYLIIYYAYTGSGYQIDKELIAYPTCSIYGWLGYTKNADVISSSHKTLNSFKSYQISAKDRIANLTDKDIYKLFLVETATNMFDNIKPYKKQ